MKRWKSILTGLLAAAMLVSAAAAAAPKPAALSDLNGHWAQKEIQQAIQDGWVDGYPDGTFKPDKTITRAEFTKLLMDAVHLTPDCETIQWMKQSAYTGDRLGKLKPYKPSLSDMKQHWLTRQGWLDAALYSGMVVPEDYNNNNFRPEKAIARYEIALMADRAMGLVQPAMEPSGEKLPFTDNEDILDWMKGYVSQAVEAGVLHGYPDGRFLPKKTSTRAEAVTMVFRTLDYIQGKDASDIQTVLYHYDNSKTAQMDAKGIRLQVADNRIYASVRDIFREEAILRYKKGFTDQKPGSDGDFLWFPIEQRIHKTKNLDYAFQAGYQHCLDGIDTADIAIHDSDAALLAPARLVWGEIMIPVYDFRSGESNRWHAWNGDWDGKTKTLTIRTYYPDGRLS